MEFNGHEVEKAGNYSDYTFAASVNFPAGLYSYDVTPYIETGDNVATVRMNRPAVDYITGTAGTEGLCLLMIYRDEDELLTKYWINEGADLIKAKNKGSYNSGLPFDKCIVNAIFEGVEQEDLEKGNTTLLTVLGGLKSYPLCEDANGEGDALRFNVHSVGSLIGGPDLTSHWQGVGTGGSGMALTENKWEDATDYLREGANLVEIQSKGNYMWPANAILTITYPPDLVPSLENAPSKVVVGNLYDISVVIRNEGRSKAKNFNVSFYVDDGEPLEQKEHVDMVEGEKSTTVYFPWTAPCAVGTINLTVVVDPDNDIEKLINRYRNGESNKSNVDTISMTVGLGEIIPPTSFVINGWIEYENGTACNAPSVSIANTNTSKEWIAETSTASSYYQLIVGSDDVSVGDLLRFNTSGDSQSKIVEYMVTQSEITNGGIFDFNISLEIVAQIFDTSSPENPYPSIFGTHKGTIVLNHTINVNKIYTYTCVGTGGHTEYVEISNESGIVAVGQWDGYEGDWHNISFSPSFRMLASHTYNYTIHTGSYPQIIHKQNHTTFNGYINCTSFIDANGRKYNDWIPAIRLWKG
ncbi:hypothetical protein C5S32_06670 [ANME-1 cluster archaeon GoMg1]|nr:hypothetical protein [ANME-1 cluster archaeon GoMg1]